MLNIFEKWLSEIQADAIATKKAKARACGDESTWKSQVWAAPQKNSAIKQRFGIEGKRLGYDPRPWLSENSKCEWLYDVAWRKFDDSGNLLSVDLVMEIEMSDTSLSGIKYDFNKLLQTDAEYRVMIFQMKEASEIAVAFDVLQQASQRYKAKSEFKLLLCGWCTSQNTFMFKHIHSSTMSCQFSAVTA